MGVSVNGNFCVLPFGSQRQYNEALIRTASFRQGPRCIIEVAIPFEFLGVPTPRAGEAWRFNLTGQMAADLNQYISWNPTYGGFQNPERFGSIRFED